MNNDDHRHELARQGSGRRSRRRYFVLALAASSALTLAACGSSSTKAASTTTGASTGVTTSATTGATSSSPTTASGGGAGGSYLTSIKAALVAEEAIPTYQGPTSGPKPQVGKKIAVIECAAVNTGCVSGADSVRTADTAAGWTTSILDGKGTPSVDSQDMVTAINDGDNAIVLIAIPSNSILQGMEAAKRAHIPVISVVADNPMGTATGDVYAEISGSTVPSGKDIADDFIAASNGTAQVASFHIAGLASTVNRYKGFVNEIATCSGCKVVSDQTYGIVSQADFTGLIKGTVTAHPNIQYIFVDVSQYATIAATALVQEGLAHKIGVAGVDCLPAETQSIKDGTGEIACAEDATSLAGWPTTNELIRAFAGLPALQEAFPLRLITKSIIDSGTPPYLGGFTPATGYLKLWGKS